MGDELSVSHEDLDAASEPATEASAEPVEETVETTEETTATEETTVQDEPVDNTERSNLGRKVKTLESLVEEMREMIQQPVQEEDQEDENDPIYTKKELEDYLQRRDASKQTSEKKYNDNVIRSLGSLGADLTDADHDEIVTEVSKTFVRKFNDPALDAEYNFTKAHNKILLNKVKTPTNPLKGETPNAPLGGGVGENILESGAKPVKLSDEAKAFVKYHNMAPEKVAEALA